MKRTKNFQYLLAGIVIGGIVFGGSVAYAAGILATPSTNKILVNGKEVKVEAYLIDGRNYLQLRDMADAVGFSVEWDGVNNQVLIQSNGTNSNNTPETTTPTTSAPTTTPRADIPAGILEKDIPIWTDENYEPYENELEVIRLVNEERQKAGINPVTINYDLCKVARIKAIEMVELDYFSHESPNYGAHTDMVKKFGIKCTWAGENIGRQGGTIPAGVMYNWMHSEGHKKHILNPKLKEIGVGVADAAGLGYWSLFMMY